MQAVRSVASGGNFSGHPLIRRTLRRGLILHLWKDQLQGHSLVAPMSPGTLFLLLCNYSRTPICGHLFCPGEQNNDPFIDSCLNLCTKATHLYNGHFILSQRWLLCWGTTIGNLCFFIEIIRWPPWISWVRSTRLPFIFFRAFKKYSQLSLE